jgi:hypothetical protein
LKADSDDISHFGQWFELRSIDEIIERKSMATPLQPMARFDDVITRFNELSELDDRPPGKSLLASREKEVGGEIDEGGLVTDQRLDAKIESAASIARRVASLPSLAERQSVTPARKSNS